MVSSLPPTTAKAKAKSKVSKSTTASSSSTPTGSPLAQIAKLESTLTDGEYDPNPLLPLLSLARNDAPQVVHKAVWALHRVFIKLIGDGRVAGLNGDLTVKNISRDVVEGAESGLGGVEGDEEREVKSWVRERLLEYAEILGGLVRDAEPALRSSSVPLLFSLLPPLSTSASTSTPLTHIPYFRLILHYLYNPSPSLRGAKSKTSGAGWKVVAANQAEDEQGALPVDVAKIVVDDFWAKYDDIRWAFFKESANLLQTSPESVIEPTNLLSQLLPLTNLPKQAEDINAFYIPSFSTPPSGNKKAKKAGGSKKGKGKTRYTGEVDALPDWMAEYESSGSEDESDADEGASNGKKGSKKRTRQRTSQMSVHASVHSVLSHTTWYTTLWENVLSSLKIDDLWIRKILIGLHGDQGILGHFKPERRLRIADWLGSLVDGGGALAMLAMNGLFVLITQYNFEYPHFYDRLYGLLDRNVMHVRYRARFFRLLDMFLSSSLISSALIASFIKRLSRLALTAPPSGVILIIPFIYNLFKRHPGCMIMLQRPSSSSYTPPVLALSFASSNGDSQHQQGQEEADPYDPEEKSVLKTKALESSCWELAALQKHYLAPIATLAKIFGEVFTKPEFNMEDFLDHGYGTLFETEANRRIKNPPALSIALDLENKDEPLDLFPSAAAASSAEEKTGDEQVQLEEETVVGIQADVINALWVF
ncbi:hypothetical protein IAU59_004654 [Kwoniella sp. CBS 9459]